VDKINSCQTTGAYRGKIDAAHVSAPSVSKFAAIVESVFPGGKLEEGVKDVHSKLNMARLRHRKRWRTKKIRSLGNSVRLERRNMQIYSVLSYTFYDILSFFLNLPPHATQMSLTDMANACN
jgi:hypothetical protein